jgi:hypothetical protein
MAQHDMNIANQGFPATRADLNNALQALVSNSSGATEPSTTFANQWWYDTTNNKMYLRNEANNAWIEVFALDQTNNEWQLVTGQISAADGDGIAFKTDDGITRVTLDDSGNLLAGQTTASSNTVGTSFRTDGRAFFCADGNYSAQLNRKTSDGAIVNFAKDDTVVGKVSSFSGVVTSLILDPRSGGCGIQGAGAALRPVDETNATADDTVDLGTSGVRFKDLYLSGGAYLGGTGAANYLDDYEEGTFTPKFRTTTSATDLGSSYSGQSGRYVKIGNIVYFELDMTAGSIGSTSGSICAFGGLPFTSSGSSLAYPVNCRNTTSITVASGERFQPFVVAAGDFVFVQSESLTTQASSNISSYNSSGRANIHGWYTVF